MKIKSAKCHDRMFPYSCLNGIKECGFKAMSAMFLFNFMILYVIIHLVLNCLRLHGVVSQHFLML